MTKSADYYRVSEAATVLKVSHSTVWRWIKSGRLPAQSVGPKTIRITHGALADFLGSPPVPLQYAPALEAEASRHYLAALVESFQDAIISQTLAGIITSWNPAAERMYGYTAQELIDRPITILCPPQQADEIPTLLGRLRRGERIEHHETIRRRKDGQRLHVSLTISPIRDATGHIIGASTIAQDITARKEAAREREQLAVVVEHSSDFIAIANPDGLAFYVNEAGRRLVGLEDLAEVRRTHIIDYFFPEDVPFVQQQILPTVLRDGRWQGEIRFRNFQTGAPIWVIWKVFAIRDPRSDALLAIAMASRDITARKEVEEQLAFQAHVLSQVSDAVIAIDNEQRIIFWNPAAEQLYGFTAAEALGRPLEAITQHQWLDPTDESAAYHSLANRGNWQGESRHTRRNGERMHVEFTVSLLKEAGGDGRSAISR